MDDDKAGRHAKIAVIAFNVTIIFCMIVFSWLRGGMTYLHFFDFFWAVVLAALAAGGAFGEATMWICRGGGRFPHVGKQELCGIEGLALTRNSLLVPRSWDALIIRAFPLPFQPGQIADAAGHHRHGQDLRDFVRMEPADRLLDLS